VPTPAIPPAAGFRPAFPLFSFHFLTPFLPYPSHLGTVFPPPPVFTLFCRFCQVRPPAPSQPAAAFCSPSLFSSRRSQAPSFSPPLQPVAWRLSLSGLDLLHSLGHCSLSIIPLPLFVPAGLCLLPHLPLRPPFSSRPGVGCLLFVPHSTPLFCICLPFRSLTGSALVVACFVRCLVSSVPDCPYSPTAFSPPPCAPPSGRPASLCALNHLIASYRSHFSHAPPPPHSAPPPSASRLFSLGLSLSPVSFRLKAALTRPPSFRHPPLSHIPVPLSPAPPPPPCAPPPVRLPRSSPPTTWPCNFPPPSLPDCLPIWLLFSTWSPPSIPPVTCSHAPWLLPPPESNPPPPLAHYVATSRPAVPPNPITRLVLHFSIVGSGLPFRRWFFAHASPVTPIHFGHPRHPPTRSHPPCAARAFSTTMAVVLSTLWPGFFTPPLWGPRPVFFPFFQHALPRLPPLPIWTSFSFPLWPLFPALTLFCLFGALPLHLAWFTFFFPLGPCFPAQFPSVWVPAPPVFSSTPSLGTFWSSRPF